MANHEPPNDDTKIREYEKFGLYPYKTLQDIVARLVAGEYKDSSGQAMVDSQPFRDLEKMADEPPIPDPLTEYVAGILHYFELAGYKNKSGESIGASHMIIALKLLNARQLLWSQSEDALHLLQILEATTYLSTFGLEVRELKDDPAFNDLREVITLAGKEGRK